MASDAHRHIKKILSDHFGHRRAKQYEKKIRSRAKNNETIFELVGQVIMAQERGMSPEEILSEHASTEWSSKLYEREISNLKKIYDESTYKPDVKEGELQCKRCGGKKTLYYQMQTRSADEGMTTFYTCAECGNRWRG